MASQLADPVLHIQLLAALNCWTKSLDEGHSVNIIYFDLVKAFDLVPHTQLLAHSNHMGYLGIY